MQVTRGNMFFCSHKHLVCHVIYPLVSCGSLEACVVLQTFPFFGVVAELVTEEGKLIEGTGEGYLVGAVWGCGKYQQLNVCKCKLFSTVVALLQGHPFCIGTVAM